MELNQLFRENPLLFVGMNWVSLNDAKVSIFDHGLLYGDGIYEGLRAYNGIVFKQNEHLSRLELSARCLGINIPFDCAELSDLIKIGLVKNKLVNAYIRLIVTRGIGPIGPDPIQCGNPQLILIVLNIPPLYGQKKSGIRVALSSVKRCAVDSATAQIKSLNYMTTVLGKLEANRIGVDDVLLMDHRGFIAEAPVANVFIVRNGKVFTPLASSGILEGITRQTVIEILLDYGVPVYETDITPYDASVADEIFFTGTHAEIVPVSEYNGLKLDGEIGKITSLVTDQFSTLTGKATE